VALHLSLVLTDVLKIAQALEYALHQFHELDQQDVTQDIQVSAH
jgi:hypothetical protein